MLAPGVKIMTIQSAKGIEFDHVILPRLTNGYFPYIRAAGSSHDEWEDAINRARSLLFVGMTRARLGLYMLTIKGLESPLLRELDPEKYISEG